ncbi:MAG: outer membrane lipoprotein carrier protein LolA, partial [Terrimicrobiaceae bacterium]|nr:outer membrane lipoprotein carrier protein LolA [Terrimicrobiaceae bacterium]
PHPMVSICPAARSLPLLTALFAAALLRASPVPEAELSALLDNLARRSSEGFSARFEETRSLPLFSKPIIESGTLEFQPPALFRKDVRSPSPSITICDGNTLWLLFPNDREGEAYPFARSSAIRDTFATLTACLDPAQIPKFFNIEAEKKTSGITLSLTPKKPQLRSSFTKATLLFDSTPSLLSLTLESADGASSTLKFSQHRKPSLPPAAFKSPADYKLTYPLGQ